MKYDPELAAAGLFTLVALVLFCGFLTAMLGMAVDSLVATHNGLIGTFPTSQDSINTGINLVAAFKAMMFLLMLALGLNYLNVSQSDTTGNG